jgi:hypothetical protein
MSALCGDGFKCETFKNNFDVELFSLLLDAVTLSLITAVDGFPLALLMLTGPCHPDTKVLSNWLYQQDGDVKLKSLALS